MAEVKLGARIAELGCHGEVETSFLLVCFNSIHPMCINLAEVVIRIGVTPVLGGPFVQLNGALGVFL
ncbi:unnamed protein product [Chondrus crispus]|uniref:Uncharacterized protein n=1 Tax=Chondrus crispus TaxID=2769 RepID=R7Q875_CHOCR|nr:unnamed protein product [Chondrus crispus]CDF34752.1 unnamed protein product [Chondrus crispus]|eukprot:XP_005714571.1 unnamed protein product [Chondrus crispus]